MFQIAERLHQPVTVVGRMSNREVQAWIDHWNEERHDSPTDGADDAIDMATLSQADLRAMFPGRR